MVPRPPKRGDGAREHGRKKAETQTALLQQPRPATRAYQRHGCRVRGTVTAIAILSPGFPDMAGGVTDHTQRLFRGWSARGHEVTVIGELNEGLHATCDKLRSAGVAALLIQYVPFLYGRRGLSLFPERLGRSAGRAGIRVTTLVHEPWVPPTRLPWIVLGPLQRIQLLRLLRLSHGVVTPVPRWRERLGCETTTVYVGSTLGEPKPATVDLPPIEAPVVFSPFASELRWEWIVQAVRAIGMKPSLTIIGADRDQVRLHHSVGRWFRPEWECLGRLPATEVLALLARAQLVLAPFNDGVTGRRTSLFAAASSGARILSSDGHDHDDFFSSSPFHIAKSRDDFVERAISLWKTPDDRASRSARIEWYHEALDPQRLDSQLLNAVVGQGQ